MGWEGDEEGLGLGLGLSEGDEFRWRRWWWPRFGCLVRLEGKGEGDVSSSARGGKKRREEGENERELESDAEDARLSEVPSDRSVSNEGRVESKGVVNQYLKARIE